MSLCEFILIISLLLFATGCILLYIGKRSHLSDTQFYADEIGKALVLSAIPVAFVGAVVFKLA